MAGSAQSVEKTGSAIERRNGFTSEQIRVLALSGVGGAIELYEFIVYILLTPYISQAFFSASVPEWLRTIQTLSIFALGYLIRPFGGVAIAIVGDMLGRKRMFSLTIFLMAVPTLLIGLLPTYAQVGAMAPVLLLLCRLAQGLALGGEVPGAAVFVAEHSPYRHLGFACSLVGAGLALGLFLGAVTVGMFTELLGPQNMGSYGWRGVFVIGGVLGLFAAYVRHYVRETPVFETMKQRHAVLSHVPLSMLFRTSRAQLLAGLAISFMAAAVIPVMILYPPIYMRSVLHFETIQVHDAQITATAALILGSVIGGWLTDTVGAVKTYALYALGLIVTAYVLLFKIQSGPEYLSGLYALVGFFCGISALGYFFLVQGFSPQVRFTGVALPYNISNALGGTLPIVVATLITHDALVPAHIIAVLAILSAIAAPILWRHRVPVAFVADTAAIDQT